MTTAIVTTGADAHHFRGALIANNILDIGRRLFIGGIINSTFSGNVVENGTRGSIISVTSGGANLTFTGNVLGEAEPSTRELLHCIEFGPGAAGRNITITGNSFNWVDRSPVYFAGAATDVTISANSFDNWNLVAEERWGAIRIEGAAKGLSVMGNAFGANPATTAPPVRVVGEVSGSTLVGNTWVNTAGVLYAGTVGDRNYIDRRSAGANQHELTAVKNGALVVRATGAPGVGADAFGSFVAASEQATGAGPGVKGGVRVVPTNTTGSAAVELLCSTNSSNGVAAMRVDITGLVPTADNARDIGSAQNRVRTVHAHNLQLATVAAADLPAPAAGAIVMVKDPATGAITPAISDGTAWHRMSLGAAIK